MAELLRIGEAAKALGVTPKTLRFYEQKGIISPSGRSPAGYRLYSPEDFERVRFVLRAKGMGLVLDEAREVLACADAACCGASEPMLEEKLRERLADIEARLQDLEALRENLLHSLSSVEAAKGRAGAADECGAEVCLPQVGALSV